MGLEQEPLIWGENQKMIKKGTTYVLKRSAGRDLVKAVDEVLKGATFVSPSIDVSKQMKEELS